VTEQDEEERPRPDFAAKAPYLEKNPITGIREPAFPRAIRLRRIAAGSGLILLMVGTNISAGYVLILLIAGILARLAGSSFAW
jgi:anoctamin-7